MAAKGYCTVAQIQAWHGGTLSTADQATVTAWMEFAEQVIDADTGNPFLTGPILGEQHGVGIPPDGAFVWTQLHPLASVEAVRGYLRPTATNPPITLALGTDYEVDSLAQGRIWIGGWQAFAYFRLDYTPVATVPRPVSEGTALLLSEHLNWAATIGGATSASGGVVTEERFAEAIQKYAAVPPPAAEAGWAISPTVRAVLGPWSRAHQIVFV
ncbi:MAG TPA: hypothetical protein VE953_11050 [Terriglobales bacterium]|nr:hypothetical protein [Terriglobales bacterium]